MRLHKISHFATSLKPFFRNSHTIYLHRTNRFYCSFTAVNQTGDGEFSNWKNGGGLFHKSAKIDTSARVEIGAVIHNGAVLGPNVCISSGAVIGPEVTVGNSTNIGYNVCLSNCSVGDSCVIHNGVCIGQDGFGFFVDEKGNVVKKPQLLRVIIGNDVEIGANTCINRGSWRDTVTGDHSKIDNLVQLHALWTKLESQVLQRDYVTLGGRAAVRDHVSIVSKVRLAANSCVTRDITEPGDFGGFPAIPIRQWRRQVAKHRWMSRVAPTNVDG